MADDPNRDLLPVKEGSCVESCRSLNAEKVKDGRERHSVVKLDRYQLEDRYLQMRDEVLQLKKLSNAQEDKIKRLATKLMRASATPGSCLETALDFHAEKSRQEELERENAKLKEKITVLRNQILNHKIGGRSPSQGRRHPMSASLPTTCRSELGRIRSSTSHLIREPEKENEKNPGSCLAKIEELEIEKKELKLRIEVLETQIANHETGNQRKKVAENVEFIRVWRQMKLQNEELVSSQARNVSLEEQIRDLKELVEEKSRNIKDITNALLTEKKKINEMDDQLSRAKSSQLTLREKDEQIRDLMNEMKILHQHNAELIALSSKYSNAEVENIELRKKISEQMSDNLSLKSAFNNEQANIAALQAANAQLMAKLHELQTNIDTLTIQLKAFQSQNEKSEGHNIRSVIERQTCTNSYFDSINRTPEKENRVVCKNCRGSSRRIQPPNYTSQESQTEDTFFENASNVREKRSGNFDPGINYDRSFQHENRNLTPEEMINLLEKAQINTPLEAQNVSRNIGCAKNCPNAPETRKSSSPVTKKSGQSLSNDPWQILRVVYNILRENVENSSKVLENLSSCVRDENNNDNFSPNKKTGNDRKRMESRDCCTNRTCNVDQDTEINNCICAENEKCSYEVDCGYPCVPSISTGEINGSGDNFDNCRCEVGRDSFKNFVNDFSSSIQKTFDNIHQSRVNRVDNASVGLYKSWQRACETRNAMNRCTRENDSKFTVCRQAQCLSRGKIKDEILLGELGQFGFSSLERNDDDQEEEEREEDENSKFGPPACLFYYRKNHSDTGFVAPPLPISKDQGILEMHILRLQLTSISRNIFRKESNARQLSLFVSWDLWGDERAYTPNVKYPDLKFNTSMIYRITCLSDFLDRLLGQSISFRVHVSRDENISCPIARSFLNIREILEYPQNKFYFVADFSSILPCSRNKHFGQLSLSIRLSCDLQDIERFKRARGLYREPLREVHPAPEDKKAFFSSLDVNGRLHQDKLNYEASLESDVNMDGNVSHPAQSNSRKLSAFSQGMRHSRLSVTSSGKEIIHSETSSSLERSFTKSKKRPSNANSYLTISEESSIAGKSDSSLIHAMGDEGTTSEEFRERIEKIKKPERHEEEEDEDEKSKQPQEKELTSSVKEFNKLIRKDTILSPRESKNSVEDLGTVFTDDNWRKYRKKSMAAHAKTLRPSALPLETNNQSVDSRLFQERSEIGCDAIIIRIESLTLFQRSSILNDPLIHRLYVEFSFLECRGAELETISVPKPPANTTAYFNYMRKFQFDKAGYSNQRKIMKEIMRGDERATIKFILVSEPLAEEMETKECEEVGCAFFNIRNHIISGSSKDVSLTIMDIEETEPIGILKITLLGAEAIRRCLSDL